MQEIIKTTMIGLFFGTFGTTIGGIIGVITKKHSKKFLSFVLAFASGLMMAIICFDLIPEALEISNIVNAIIGILLGIVMMIFCDKLVEKKFNIEETNTSKHNTLLKTGIIVSIGLAIHNFPEGLATFATALSDPELALPIMFAIAIHNIPEGIAVSVPIYHASGSRRKAFWYSALSGIAEPVGALCGYLFLRPFWTPEVNAFLLAFVSGIMIYISFDELLPGTEKYGHHHWGIAGVISGMAIMAISLLLL